ncbi:MAG: ATP-binding protein [Eubacteriales bacterium]|nr:ATP-binding protein [Eubacteriales bacterium]
MAMTIISLVIILIITIMAVFAFRNEVLCIENHKDSMLSFNIKYSDLIGSMRFNVKQYLATNDNTNRTKFYSLINEYLLKDNLSSKYRVFTKGQTDSQLKITLAGNDFTISRQLEYIQLNPEEEELYNEFLLQFQNVINMLDETVRTDESIITSAEFENVYNLQHGLMTELSKTYIERLNQEENKVLIHQKMLEYGLVSLTLIILIFSAVTFCMILRENASNSYFSKLYNTVVENIDSGIAILDNNYHFDYMNPKYKEILGISTDNVKRKSIHDTFDQWLAEIIENVALNNNRNEIKLDFVIEGKRKSSLHRFFEIDDGHANNKYVHFIRDISKTEELQQQLKKRLLEINFYSKAKDSFIANISHEIKTPISVVLSMVHFLKRTHLSDNQKELVSRIETSSDILLTIISDVLDLSKINNGSLSLYPSNFSLKTAIKSVEDMFSGQLSQKGVEWRTEYDFNEELCLHLDKTRLVQVLVNLISNAIKFTDSGYVKLSVETLSETKDSVLLQFCVEDTGIGIAEKDISRLFREFEQFENHLTKQHQGTGLGLFISKNIVDSMEGRMWVKSTRGEGSMFYFTMPARKGLENIPKDILSASDSLPLDGSGRKALVVEDTEINAEVVVRLLNDINISCDTATDGISAVQMCKNQPLNYYNVILMDIHMPNMDGYTAAHILKNEIGVTSPIIALTASDINDLIKDEQAKNIESFLLKPFKVESLYKEISPYFQFDSKTDNDMEENPDPVNPIVSDTTLDNPLAGREEAIKNLGGYESIYNKHIQKFKATYDKSTEQIASLLEEKNYGEARRLAHSIKGLSGTLGMLNVMESSTKLEKAILKGEGHDLSKELDDFDKDLKAVIAAI